MAGLSRGAGRRTGCQCALVACVILLCVPSMAAAKGHRPSTATGPTIVLANISFAATGSYTAHASDTNPEDFVSGQISVGFSWYTSWENTPLVVKEGSIKIPGLSEFGSHGISSPNESFTGTWNASGEEIVPATNNEHRQFTCPGGKLSEAVGAGQPKLFVNPMGESFVLKMAVAGAGEYGDWSNCLFPEGGAFLGHTFWNDEETPTGPFSGEITITKADLAQETTKAISPTHSQLPTGSCEAPNAGGSKFVAANECTSSFNWTGTVIIEPRCEHVTTGKGYSGLSATMKADLGSLYAKLKSEKACFHFTIGTRSRSEQEDLYDRWHAIADGAENKPPAQVEKELKKAGFAQQPEGWEPDGTAKGGPAMPGHSRHESSEAADITVVYPPKYEPDTARFHAAAASAGLCGPPASDKVHVELPYKKKGQTVATCHFG